jgi:hypothetical protein
MPRVCPKCYGDMEVSILGDTVSGNMCSVKYECSNGHRIFEQVANAVKAEAAYLSKKLTCPRCDDEVFELYVSPIDSLVCVRCMAELGELEETKQHMKSIVVEGR